MKKLSISATERKGLKGMWISGGAILLLLTVYVCTAAPLSAWLFYHRAGGVPAWLDRAYLPLQWLRAHSELAERCFAWQSRHAGVPDGYRGVPLNDGVVPPGNLDPEVDVESRVKALERYLVEPEPRRGGKPDKQLPER
jgi:hypothetical protein